MGNGAPREAGEEDRAYPDMELLAGLLSGSGVRDCPPEVLTRDALTRVADHLHPVFATPDPAGRVSLTARLLDNTGVKPALDLTGDGPRATWQVDDDRQVLTAAAALTLRDQLASSDPDRIGTCTGRRCADAYIDASHRPAPVLLGHLPEPCPRGRLAPAPASHQRS